MTNNLLPLLSIMAIAMVLTIGNTTNVFADMGTIKLESGGDEVLVVDQDGDDENPNEGVVKSTQSVGVFDVDMTATGLELGSTGMPVLDQDLQTLSSGPGTLIYTYSANDFEGTQLTCTNFGGGTTDGTVNYKVYIDTANQIFGKETLVFESDHAGPSINVNLANSINPNGLFSITLVSTVVHEEAGATSHDIRTECEGTVAGELLPISTQSLVLGGLGASLSWLVPVVASVGGTAAYIQYRRK